MALEDLIGSLYQYNMGLPLNYANPYFSFLNNQAGNMTSLGNQYQGNMGSLGGQAIGGSASLGNSAMGLYGNLAGQQASMYQSELPMQMEMQKYNSLAPALSGLLGQFGGGLGGMNISPISMNFNRPDVMGGYQGAVNNAYKNFGNTTNQAYGHATDAYGRAHSDTTEIGNQFQGQWQNLQDRVFPNQQGGTQKPPAATPIRHYGPGGPRVADGDGSFNFPGGPADPAPRVADGDGSFNFPGGPANPVPLSRSQRPFQVRY
jgi:hypothetical protein